MSNERICNYINPRVHQMFEQPAGWLNKSLPKFQQFSIVNGDHEGDLIDNILPKLQIAQKRRWFEDVGIPPEDTHATVIIPIKNEAKCLPSMIGSLMMSDIPDSAHIQFLFFLNGCNDGGLSRTIVETFLREIGPIQHVSLRDCTRNSGMKELAWKTSRNNLQFLLIESEKPSKTNVLNIGNELAYQRGDRVTINIDANNWLEPDALRSLVSTAYQNIDSGKAVVFGSKSVIAYKESRLAGIFVTGQKPAWESEPRESKDLHGWLMAWDTTWFEEIGGLPKIACDDYTLSLLSRKVGKEVIFDKEAYMWGYHPNNLLGRLRAHSRTIRDRIQIRKTFSEDSHLLALLDKDEPHVWNPSTMLFDFVSDIRRNPKQFPRHIVKVILGVFARIFGKIMYENNSEDQTWNSIISTK